MFAKIQTGFALAKKSFSIIASRKRFLIFPILSMLFVFFCLIAVIIATFFTLGEEGMRAAHQSNTDILSVIATQMGKDTLIIAAILFVFLSVFISTIMNSALLIATKAYLENQEITLFSCFKKTFSHIGRLFFWSCLVTVITIIMFGIENLISRRSKLLGDIIGNLEKTAWAVISFFALPVMLFENQNPFRAIKRSGSLLKQTWGVALTSNASVGLILLLLFITIFSPAAFALYVGNIPLFLHISLFSTCIFILMLIINAALKTVLKAALYLYACGKTPAVFDTTLLQNAFKNQPK